MDNMANGLWSGATQEQLASDAKGFTSPNALRRCDSELISEFVNSNTLYHNVEVPDEHAVQYTESISIDAQQGEVIIHLNNSPVMYESLLLTMNNNDRIRSTGSKLVLLSSSGAANIGNIDYGNGVIVLDNPASLYSSCTATYKSCTVRNIP